MWTSKYTFICLSLIDKGNLVFSRTHAVTLILTLISTTSACKLCWWIIKCCLLKKYVLFFAKFKEWNFLKPCERYVVKSENFIICGLIRDQLSLWNRVWEIWNSKASHLLEVFAVSTKVTDLTFLPMFPCVNLMFW